MKEKKLIKAKCWLCNKKFEYYREYDSHIRTYCGQKCRRKAMMKTINYGKND